MKQKRIRDTKWILPEVKGRIFQIFQSHPAGFWYVLFSELPNERLLHGRSPQKPTMGQNHHTLLAPREHDVRSPLVLHEPRSRGPNDRNYDVIFFVSLKRVNVEDGVLPGEICGLERLLDRVSLSIVGGNDLEAFAFSYIAFRYSDCCLDLALVLRGQQVFSVSQRSVLGRIVRTVQLTPCLSCLPLLTSTKRQQVLLMMSCTVWSFER